MISSWTTRPGATPLDGLRAASPGLLFHKWQAWDESNRRDPSRTKARLPHLEKVGEAVEAAYRDEKLYAAWIDRYESALGALPGEPVTRIERATIWRLVVGMATNPALESGLSLHPILGVPYLSGSSLKGLTHHAAEQALAEALGYQMPDDPWEEHQGPECPSDLEELNALLDQASLVRAVFGSLAVERARRATDRGSGGARTVPWGRWTPRAILEAWSEGDSLERQGDPGLEAQARLRALLEPTGGGVAFYDALPVPGQTGPLVETDVMTPHYPKYYDSRGGSPPSDDQDPRPVTFLSVAPDVTFRFAFRLRETPVLREAMSRVEATGKEVRERVARWLTGALAEQGAGAKTAAGYGYFGREEPAEEVGTAEPGTAGGGVVGEEGTSPSVPPPRLRSDLGAGELATVLDEAMGSASTEEQEEIARLALHQYGKIIRKWRKDLEKGKGGDQRTKRVEWLGRFGAGGGGGEAEQGG